MYARSKVPSLVIKYGSAIAAYYLKCPAQFLNVMVFHTFKYIVDQLLKFKIRYLMNLPKTIRAAKRQHLSYLLHEPQ
jgi:hypothetical protein